MTKILFSLTSLKNINFPRLWVKFPDFSLTFCWPFPDLWQDKGKKMCTWARLPILPEFILCMKRLEEKPRSILKRTITLDDRQRQANRALRSLRIQIKHSNGFHKVSWCIWPLYGISDVFYHLLYVRVAFYEMNYPILKATCVFTSKIY